MCCVEQAQYEVWLSGHSPSCGACPRIANKATAPEYDAAPPQKGKRANAKRGMYILTNEPVTDAASGMYIWVRAFGKVETGP